MMIEALYDASAEERASIGSALSRLLCAMDYSGSAPEVSISLGDEDRWIITLHDREASFSHHDLGMALVEARDAWNAWAREDSR